MIRTIFTSFVSVNNIELDNDKIVKTCRRIIEGSDVSQSGITKETIQHEPEMVKLISITENVFNDLHVQYGFKKDYMQTVSAVWTTLNNSQNTADAHIHPDSFFTAVYYPEVSENAGSLILMNPIQPHEYVIKKRYVEEYNEFNSNIWEIKPQKGMLLVFPSWLVHFVRQQPNSENRISIAIDSSIVESGWKQFL